MEKYFPQLSAFQLRETYLRNICPESLLDLQSVEIYRTEQAVKEYGLEILDAPIGIFEGFEQVRAVENRYENWANYDREQQLKAKQK